MIDPENTVVRVKDRRGMFRVVNKLVSIDLQRGADNEMSRFALSREASSTRFSEVLQDLAEEPICFQLVFRDTGGNDVLGYELEAEGGFDSDSLKVSKTNVLDEVVYYANRVTKLKLESAQAEDK